MKSLKQTLIVAGLLVGGLTFAQNSGMNNMLKLGINAGASTGGNTSASIGADLSYQNLVTPGFGLGLTSGYKHFFGKDANSNNVNYDNNDFGVVPLAGLIRIYPKQTGFYFGTDLGYGFIVGDEKVASNSNVNRPDGGFYIKPEIGFHNKNLNFYAHYTKVFTGDEGEIGNQKYNVGSVGLGISYNIPLGN